MICGEVGKITIPHTDSWRDHTVEFVCLRKPNHKLPHISDEKTAERYDREDEQWETTPIAFGGSERS